MKGFSFNPETRKENVLFSSLTGIVFSIITIILSFVMRTVLIRSMGIAYVGLGAFLTELIGLLMSVDGGVCNSLFIKIHKPIANNDVEELSKTFRLIQVVYRIRAGLVLLVGIIIFFFLPYLASDLLINITYVKMVYGIYLILNASGYLLIYYQFILEAYQKRFITNIISFVVTTVGTIVNIICLFVFNSFVLYIFIIALSQVITYGACSVFVRRKYPDLFLYRKCSGDSLKEIKDMMKITYYTVSSVLVRNTDNILVTKMLGFTVNGIYSTYKMLNSQVFGLIGKIKYSVQDSARNYIVLSKTEDTVKLIDRLSFLYFWVSGFSIVSLATLSSPFIELWLGADYTINMIPVCLTVLTLFIDTVTSPMDDAFYSTESYKLSKSVPIIEVSINLGISIVLGRIWGISGIMIGTILYLVYKTIARSYLLYKIRLETSFTPYIAKISGYTIALIPAFTINYLCVELIPLNGVLGFACKAIVCLIIPNMVFFLLYRKSEHFIYAVEMIKNILTKRKNVL